MLGRLLSLPRVALTLASRLARGLLERSRGAAARLAALEALEANLASFDKRARLELKALRAEVRAREAARLPPRGAAASPGGAGSAAAGAAGSDEQLRDYERLVLGRVRNGVEVREPLVLISQIQRSGGTLLSQLLDDHPEIHAHPQELHTGSPRKHHWPRLDLDGAPEEWFETLYEKQVERSFVEGYSKPASMRSAQGEDTLPFAFPPSLQRALFHAAVARRQPDSSRAVFDCYMTSYFNAWLDNQNLYRGPKRWVSAFAASLSLHRESVRGFFETYPDGRLVSVVRDPHGWYTSARGKRDLHPIKRPERGYGDVETALALWTASAEAMIAARETYGERFVLLAYRELVSDTEGTMRTLAARLGIEFLPILLEPTFNGLPIKADSSYAVQRVGVISEPLERFRQVLSGEEIERIDGLAAPLYGRVMALRG